MSKISIVPKTWNEESNHQENTREEQNNPDDLLDNWSSILTHILETMEGSILIKVFDMLANSNHSCLSNNFNCNKLILFHYGQCHRVIIK